MTTFGIARLACRILALYFLLSLIHPFFGFLSLLFSKAGKVSFGDMIGFQIAFSLASVLACGGFSAMLWIFSDRIAKAMIGGADEKIEDSRITVEDLATIAFAVIGIYILSSSIPNLIRTPYWFPNSSPQRPYQWAWQVGPEVVRTLIGLWLFFRPRGFAKILHGFQEFAMTEPLDKNA